MPLIQQSTTILANATNDNIYSGSQWEFLPFNAALLFGFNASAIGLEIDVYTGQDVLVETMIPLIKATMPIFPEDYGLEDVAAGGERIKARVRNTTGGSLILLSALRITPI